MEYILNLVQNSTVSQKVWTYFIFRNLKDNSSKRNVGGGTQVKVLWFSPGLQNPDT